MEEIKKIIHQYYEESFEFSVIEENETYYIGFLVWHEKNKGRYSKLQDAHENDYPWYLDEEGNRLSDNELFEKSPCILIENAKVRKVVRRYMDFENGEVHFVKEPWFRICDQ